MIEINVPYTQTRICPFRTLGSHIDKKTNIAYTDTAYCTSDCPLCITKSAPDEVYDACAFAVMADSLEKLNLNIEKLMKNNKD